MDDYLDNDDLKVGDSYSFSVGTESSGLRLDQFLARLQIDKINQFSRSMFKNLIATGDVLLNGKSVKAGVKVREDDIISLHVPPPELLELIPEKVCFEIVYEDSDFIVIAKPPGLVVHPACGHSSGTLVHGLLYHCRDLTGINGTLRPGIVHRLDKDTSGLMVVAKNDATINFLVEQFKQKNVEKIYTAIVRGKPKGAQGTICGNIGRHPINRKKMAVLTRGGREAVTHWKIVEEFSGYCLLQIRIETGRTHQIRVHLASIGIPVAGDLVYGRKKQEDVKLGIARQCLHASSLSFFSPSSGEKLKFSLPLWPDMAETVSLLRQMTGPKGQ